MLPFFRLSKIQDVARRKTSNTSYSTICSLVVGSGKIREAFGRTSRQGELSEKRPQQLFLRLDSNPDYANALAKTKIDFPSQRTNVCSLQDRRPLSQDSTRRVDVTLLVCGLQLVAGLATAPVTLYDGPLRNTN